MAVSSSVSSLSMTCGMVLQGHMCHAERVFPRSFWQMLHSACLVNKVYHTVKGRFGVPESFLTRIRRTPPRLRFRLFAASSLELRVACMGHVRQADLA